MSNELPYMVPILKLCRSLGFGATVGGMLAVTVKSIFFSDIALPDDRIIGAGAAVGMVLHRGLDWLVTAILAPITRFSGFYLKLAQLRMLERTLTRKQRQEIVQKLAARHFIGDE